MGTIEAGCEPLTGDLPALNVAIVTAGIFAG
jgi:hypothetical protein